MFLSGNLILPTGKHRMFDHRAGVYNINIVCWKFKKGSRQSQKEASLQVNRYKLFFSGTKNKKNGI